jgi:hypothetical protein
MENRVTVSHRRFEQWIDSRHLARWQKLLADVEIQEEESKMPDWHGPSPTIWVYNFATHTATRLTPKGVLPSKPCWLNETEIVFDAQEPGARQGSIYQMTLVNKNRKQLIKNAGNASVSRQ